ncbi:MAG TPA: SDR family oxidoreductase [Acidimicrobiia bacterium]|nr:SDR family oxidoreductase [Acidimicrobiia bacterium]
MPSILHHHDRPAGGDSRGGSASGRKGAVLRFLVTGGGGFLGSVLVPALLDEGHVVRVLDSGLFGLDHLPNDIELHRGTLEDLLVDGTEELVDGVDSILHLAAVSNDPSADLDPAKTRTVNTVATERLAVAARTNGAGFVFASTASIYGDGDFLADEDSATNPLSHYAKSKAAAEEALSNLTTGQWRPVVLRFGTLFGLSPRMRFDLVVNIFGMKMAQDRKLAVYGDGLQWRPYLHVVDAARALIHFALRQPDAGANIFNVSHQNLRVVDLVDTALDLDPGLEVHFVESAPDSRTYRVSVDRAARTGFSTVHDIAQGLAEVRAAVSSGLVDQPASPIYRNAAWLGSR